MTKLRKTTKGVLVVVMLAVAPSAWATLTGNKWYPDGNWNGSAPACSGSCSSAEFAWCVGDNPGCEFSDWAGAPPGFGADCSTGRKAYCVDIVSFPEVTDYATLNQLGAWRSTDCLEDEFAVCRSDDGVGCLYSSGVDATSLNGHGGGLQAFCVLIEHLQGVIFPPIAECTLDNECDDGDPCTQDTCNAGSCNSTETPTAFGQTVTSSADKKSLEWPDTADWEMASGSFTTSGQIGSYVVEITQTGSGTSVTDVSPDPGGGAGYWYLIRRDCPTGSWQTVVGAEPARDTALP